MDKKTTADRLKEIMLEKNIKQVDILEKVQPLCKIYGEKINKSHLSQWVSGINEPNNRKLTILATALDVTEPWLMGYDVKKERDGVVGQNKKYSNESLLIEGLTGSLNAKISALLYNLEDNDMNIKFIEKYLELPLEKRNQVNSYIDFIISQK